MKRIRMRISALLLAACMVVPLCPSAAATTGTYTNFQDVPTEHWACDEINTAWNFGVVNGTYEDSDTRLYSPENTLTLAQFLAIMIRGYHELELRVEDDASPWYASAVAVAKRHGILDGVGNADMNAPATRYQMAHIIYDLLKDYGVEMPSDEAIKATQAKIGDWSKIPAQHQEAVSAVYALGILKGANAAGDYNGNGTVKRSVAAVIYCRMWDVIVDGGLTVFVVGKYGHGQASEYGRDKFGRDYSRYPTPDRKSPAPPAGVYTTPKQLWSTQPLVAQVAFKERYDLKGITSAASVNDAIDAGKRDDYPTMGITDVPNRNGYYTRSTLDLSGCKLDYDVIPLYNKYRNEWRHVPVGDAAWGLTDLLEEEAMACAKYIRPVEASSMEEAMEKLNETYWLSNGINTKYFCLAHYTDASGRTYYGVSTADTLLPGGIIDYDLDNYDISYRKDH